MATFFFLIEMGDKGKMKKRGLGLFKFLRKMRLRKLIYMKVWVTRSDSFLSSQLKGIDSFLHIKQEEAPGDGKGSPFSLTNGVAEGGI